VNKELKKFSQDILQNQDQIMQQQQNNTFALRFLTSQVECAKPYIKLGDMCYFFSFNANSYESRVDWFTAERTCKENYSGYLAVLDTLEKINNVENYLQVNYHSYKTHDFHVWTAGTFINGFWVWKGDLQPMKETNWNTGKPESSVSNNKCIGLCKDVNFLWRNYKCADKEYYICEAPLILPGK